MTKFADMHTSLIDTARVTQIRADEVARFNAQWSPAKAKAEAARAAMKAASKSGMAWA